MLQQVSFIRHISGLLTSPVETLRDVKQSSWITPVVSVALAIGALFSLPVQDKSALLTLLKIWAVCKGSQIVAVWFAGLTQGGRGSFVDVIKVGATLSLLDGAALFLLIRHPLSALLLMTLPVMCFLAIKAVHDYENDALAFRVTVSSFFAFLILVGSILSRLDLSILASTLTSGLLSS